MEREVIQDAIAGKSVGEFTEAAKSYGFRLAVERISGKPLDEGFSTWAMNRGNELEPAARLRHEKDFGLMIERAGFVTTDCGTFGASADGLFSGMNGDDDSISEYKCLVDAARIRTVIIDRDIDQFMDQIQGVLWISGREFAHFCLYVPALELAGKALTVIEVARDDEYIAELERDMWLFNDYVDMCEKMLKQNTVIKQAA